MCVCVCMGGHGCLFFSLFLFARKRCGSTTSLRARASERGCKHGCTLRHVYWSFKYLHRAPAVRCLHVSNFLFFFFWVKWNQSHFSAGFVSSNPFLHEQAEVFAFAQTASKEPDRVLGMGVRCGASHCSVKHWGVRHNTNYFGRRLLTIAWAYSFWRCTPSFSQTHKARGM